MRRVAGWIQEEQLLGGQVRGVGGGQIDGRVGSLGWCPFVESIDSLEEKSYRNVLLIWLPH